MTELVAIGTTVLRGGILGLLLVGAWRRNVSTVANAAAALAATLLPAGVEFALQVGLSRTVALGPHLPLWIAAAGFLHTLGMVGLYESSWWWWDHVTHTVSAALVAAIVYAGLHALDGSVLGIPLSPAVVAAGTVSFTLAAGVFWELLEVVARDLSERLGIETLLIPYGRRDTILDLVFDAVGALVVVLFDVRVFVPVAARAPRLSYWLLVTGIAIVVVGSLALAVVVFVGRTRPV